MATVITVHGTNATGLEAGTQWWQQGSEFQNEITALVEGSDGKPLTFQPLAWDGINSENSRRAAAGELFARLSDLESRQEHYCLVGHSHGGSIVSLALMQAAFRRRPLPRLGRWITVGTPFIRSQRASLLFHRVGIFGKAVYVSLALYLMVFLALLLPGMTSDDPVTDWGSALAIFAAGILIPFTIPFVAMWLASRRRLFMLTRGCRKRSARYFQDRWYCLVHPADEALGALASVSRLKLALFSRDFATPGFAFASLFLLPLALIWFANSELAPAMFRQHFPDNAPSGTEAGSISVPQRYQQAMLLLVAPLVAAIDPLIPKKPRDYALTMYWSDFAPAVIAFLVLLPFLFYFGCLLLTLSAMALGRGASVILSRTLDWATLRQVRRASFGNDDLGALATDARRHPEWARDDHRPLPAGLAQAIVDSCDRAAATSVARFRMMISRLAFSPGQEVTGEFFSQCLSWNELIHTSYFSAPRFRLLVAYAISRAEGFRPSVAFKSHPDYALIASWHTEIGPRTEALSVTQAAPPAIARHSPSPASL